MYCANCGTQLSPEARFCPNCATPTQNGGAAYSGQYSGPAVMSAKIVRPRQGRMIAGVCAGIGNHLGWDVTLIRIILVVLVSCACMGILAYAIGWIVIPEEAYGLPPGTVPPPPPSV